jgi:hypothetical protein
VEVIGSQSWDGYLVGFSGRDRSGLIGQQLDLKLPNGQTVLRIVLPRTATELNAWAARLGNCLASFASAVSQGACYVIGIEYLGWLTYCLEVSRQRQITRFLGARNRSPDRGHAEAIVSFLQVERVVRGH